MKRTLPLVALFIACFAHTAFADGQLDFTLHKLESGNPGNTLLVVGGIQGDEPGGFNAAALLVTHYKIKKGGVWVVPNLNFISIINQSRGIYGDLNRKFLTITREDPQYKTIRKIKSIILDSRVDMVLNLHDGSGFYRPRYIDPAHNPQNWGQSVIIDQERIEQEPYGNLGGIAQQVVAEVNEHLFSDEHAWSVKDTKTWQGNKDMEKALTYFAIRNRKPAFGVEISKEFSSARRSYYHLEALESFMNILGIEYERRFPLTPEGIESAIENNITLALYDNKILLDVTNARKRLAFIPFKKGFAIDFIPSNPLLALVSAGNCYEVYHGNRRITSIFPQYLEYDSGINAITMQIDGEEKDVRFGGIVDVGAAFTVVPREGYRVNVIGFKKQGITNESGIPICKNDTENSFSVDTAGRLYRVEVYKEKKFAGMVLVNFSEKAENLQAANPSKVSLVEQVPATKIR
ncbi:MAG: M99 family carboxypeptidase catalytic domain-containing protein [Pseudomonadota bacterium]